MLLVLGVEPLPNIRDGILVERLVKTGRNVADMRRCQYVVQRPEGVIRRQRLNVEYVDRRGRPRFVTCGLVRRTEPYIREPL